MKTTLKQGCLMLLVLCISVINMQANTLQDRKLTGTVFDQNEIPLIGVTVQIKDTKTVAVTDVNGQFSISTSGNQETLEFRYVGFKVQTAIVKLGQPVTIHLEEDAKILQETVIIGYGATTKKEVTGSISSLGSEDFNKGVFTDAMGLLQGKVAGLSVVKSGGADPMGNYEIILRGANTLTSSQAPLVIIDGIVGESLKNINFDEVETIDVLKDGSAAAIYGTRGTNGVIIITTKRAVAGRAKVEYSGLASFQVGVKRVKSLNAKQFEDAINTYSPEKANNLYGADTDWFDEITRSTPFSHRHSIAVSGGSETFSHRTTFNLEDNQGLLKNNDFKKYLFKTNLKQSAFDGILKLDMNATYSQRRYHPANRDLFYQAFIRNPTTPVYDADGDYYVVPNSGTNYYNPVAMLNERTQQGKTSDFTGAIRATVKIIDGLDWENFFTYTNSTWEDRSYKTRNYPTKEVDGDAEISNGDYQNKQFETLVKYSKNFNKHTLQAIGGYSYQEEVASSSFMQNSNFDTDMNTTHNIGAGSSLANGDAYMSSNKNRNRLVSFFGRVAYNYDNKYLASASLRREGSSRFGKNNKWGWFPAVSLGWRINEESFMKDVKFLDELKVRLGYGVTGNQGFDNYRSLMRMGRAGKFFYNGKWINSYQPVTNPEPDLKWEKKHEYNFGVDFSFFNNRLSGSIDVYHRNVKDALFEYQVPSPPYVHHTRFTNVGEITNKGVEIAVNGIPVKERDFQWSTGMTFSLNRNKLKKLSNKEIQSKEIQQGWLGGDIAVNSQRLIEGQSLGTFYGPVWLGLDELGRDLYKNADGIGQVSSDDWEKIGCAYPDFTLGWNNDFRYKNWSLNFSLRASIGGEALNTYRLYHENWAGIGLRNVMDTQYKRHANFTGKAYYSSKYVDDASFLKMDNITLGYDVPIKVKYISKLSLSFTAQDVFCITSYKGIDPEVSLSGIAPGIEGQSYYPRTTSLSLGVNVTF